MRITGDDLSKFRSTLAPAPAPIAPILSAADEANEIIHGDQSNPTVKARRARVLELLRRPAPPEGHDAELLILLAAASALPMETAEDRIKARQRLGDIARLKHPPAEVRKVYERLRITPGDLDALTHRLLPSDHDVGDFTENWPSGGLG